MKPRTARSGSRALDPELEAEFLQRLMIHLGADEVRAKGADRRAAEGRRRARACRGGRRRFGAAARRRLFDRSWRRVGLTLDRVGFTVEDRDRSQGLYYVRYAGSGSRSSRRRTTKASLQARFRRSNKPVVQAGSQYRIYVRRRIALLPCRCSPARAAWIRPIRRARSSVCCTRS